MEWKPIEEYTEGDGMVLVCMSYNLGKGTDEKETIQWVDGMAWGKWVALPLLNYVPDLPTHFMPLPAPPKE